jgi:hypothetical protein
MKKKFLYIAVVIGITMLFGVFYGAVQQAMRRGANEPQDSMANDVATSLESGARPQDLAKGQVNVATNMAPFVIVYDKTGKVIAGNGYLDGQVPQVPIGVLQAAGRDKPNSVTWQPEKGVRIASVSYATRDYYVLGGRSLKVVEHQIGTFTRWLSMIWAVCVLAVVGVYAITVRRNKQPTKKD